MWHSPDKHYSSDTDVSKEDKTSSITFRKRKHGDEFTSTFESFSKELLANMNSFKVHINEKISEMCNNITCTIKEDIAKLSETTMEIKAEMQKIRKDHTEIKKSVQSLKNKLTDMESQVGSLKESVQFGSDQNDDLMKKMSEETNKTSQALADIAKLQADNDNLKLAFNNNEQRERLLNLEFMGIPEVKDENLTELMIEIATYVGVEMSDNDIVQVNRVSPRVKLQGRPRVIVAKMSNRLIKDSLLSTIRKNRITTKAIGMPGEPKPIYVNEHLTHFYKQLLKTTKDYAKTRQYQFVWVKNGRVYVRKNDTSPFIQIAKEEDLKKLT